MGKVVFLMGIYNCEDTLGPALDSLLAQTYPNWQAVLCDDGSKDGTYQVALSYQQAHPERFVLLKNPKNLGLNATLNRCLEVAEGDYIARQDGDDVSFPQRIQEEVEALRAHPEVAFVSTALTLKDQEGIWGQTHPLPFPKNRDLIRGVPFAHAPLLIKKEALTAVGGYSEGKWLLRVEDFHLWYKLYKQGFLGMNLLTPLYEATDDREAAGRRRFRHRFNECYVRFLIFRDLKPGFWSFPHIFRPILVGLLPPFLYRRLHRGSLKKGEA